jgi:hypothetical protein
MEQQFKKTMGTLNLRVSKRAEFDEALRKRISEATLRRNFLAHHYWREAAEKFMTKDGCAEMIEELSKDADNFEQLDKDIRETTKPVREKLGINEDALNEGGRGPYGKFGRQARALMRNVDLSTRLASSIKNISFDLQPLLQLTHAFRCLHS